MYTIMTCHTIPSSKLPVNCLYCIVDSSKTVIHTGNAYWMWGGFMSGQKDSVVSVTMGLIKITTKDQSPLGGLLKVIRREKYQ